MKKYKEEIDFLIKNGEFEKREKVSSQQLEKIITFYPDIPMEFLDFLSEIGGGVFRK